MAKLSDVQAAAELDDQPVAIVIKEKNGEPYLGPDGKPCTISVLGNEAEPVRKARARVRRQVQRRMFQGAETDSEWQDLEELVAAVTGWSGWTDADENPIEPTRENVLAFLKVEHIRNQVWNVVYQHSVFFGNGSQASSDSLSTGRGSGSQTRTGTQRASTSKKRPRKATRGRKSS